MEKGQALGLRPEEVEVVDGKVVISSEELAAAIQNYDVSANAEEEAALTVNFCMVGGGR